ncbi:MAG: hypothetical protein U9R56_06285, partial [candidate division Zixibacteria bacterium]|nr:hypothetical protein [candidate division Zixibacteria bacterium]
MIHARIRILLVGLVLLFVTDAVSDRRTGYGTDDPLSAIKRDYQSGHLTLDEMVLLQLKAIRKPNELPDKYRPTSLVAGSYTRRGISMALKEIRSQWDI